MEEQQKVNFVYPSTSSSSTINQPSFTAPIVDNSIALTNLIAQRQPVAVTLSQIYPSRKIKSKSSFRKRSCSNSMPYYIPFRNRQRTKSESQDNNLQDHNPLACGMECENSNSLQMELDYTANQPLNTNPQLNKFKMVQLKKSKSLESLCSTKEGNKELQKEQNSTMEFFDLNHRIQNLKLNLVLD